MADQENRIARLEESLFFQERLVTELNEALTAQQFQIDQMEKALHKAHQDIKELRLMIDAGGGENTRPPHYQ